MKNIDKKFMIDKNLETDETKERIIKQILNHFKLKDNFQDITPDRLHIHYESVLSPDSTDAVAVLKLDKKNSLISVYSINEDDFQFEAPLGRFYDVTEITFVPFGESGQKIVVLREEVNMHFGAFERNVFMKGYLWQEGLFGLVLNVSNELISYWNATWLDQNANPEWMRLTLKSDVKWECEDNAILYLFEAQEFSSSNDPKSIELPHDRSFVVKNSRFIVEEFHWSSKWNYFVLYERLLIKNNQTVAVLKDIEMTPYSLVNGPIQKSVVLSPDRVISVESNIALYNA